MPSDLPIIRVRTSQENIDKLKIIAKEHNRSMSGELEFELLQLIKRYEYEHGEIKAEENTAPKQSISINNNHGVVMGDNNGTMNL